MIYRQGTFLKRSPLPYGYYCRMGVMDCVAFNQTEYVDIAVKIGTDPDYRAKIKNKILQNHGILYNNREAVEKTVKFFLSVCEKDGQIG